MAGFMSPTILFLQTWGSPERAYGREFLSKALARGYTRYVEPSVGGFAMPLVARTAGYRPEQMECSDVNLYSSVLGCLYAGVDLGSLGVEVDGAPFEFDSNDPVAQAAQLLNVQYYLRMMKREGLYWDALVEDLRERRGDHRAQLEAQLAEQVKRVGGLEYHPWSVWAHLEKVADDPHAVVICNPPTYKGAYEKFFDTAGRLTWAQPEYDVFDAAVDIPGIMDRMKDARALCLVQQQQTPRNAASDAPVYARQLAPEQLVYLNANRPDEVLDMMGGLRSVPRGGTVGLAARKERPWRILPPDYEVTEKSTVRLVPVEVKVANWYRRQWMHRLGLSSGGLPVMVLVDGMAAGVFGYSLTTIMGNPLARFRDCLVLQYAFGAPHELLRLTRLVTMLSLQHSSTRVVENSKNAIMLAAAEGVVTSEFTRYPESKGLRGLMKLDNRQKVGASFKLVYRTVWKPEETPDVILGEFLQKEKQWRKSRK